MGDRDLNDEEEEDDDDNDQSSSSTKEDYIDDIDMDSHRPSKRGRGSNDDHHVIPTRQNR